VFDQLGRGDAPLPASCFDSATAEDRLARFYGVGRWTGSAVFARRTGGRSGAIAYVEKTQISERPPLQRPGARGSRFALFIDPATRANLEIERTLSGSRQGSLLKAIDRTVTGGGGRCSPKLLRSPLTDPTRSTRGSIPSPS
jgi:DNA mismatch repair protein MutS